ncbi:hypothetical protein [Pseudomonas alvandae]|uniref:hypothetical protein n=1 Tax=Pseudomonas canavaninivorans TaxID=2842348 RepID=UPI002B1E654C|nr:hypothetical protein [Pseudomonas canavaninivorans]
MQLYQNATTALENQQLIEETAVVLELLAFTLAIIAQPGTTAALGKVLAVLAYNCATNWAELLTSEFSQVEGGAQ